MRDGNGLVNRRARGYVAGMGVFASPAVQWTEQFAPYGVPFDRAFVLQ